MAEEKVNHPLHYGGDTIYEAIKVIEAWGLGFNLGNAVKYISRAGKKPDSTKLDDLLKARWYLDREIANITSGPATLVDTGRNGPASGVGAIVSAPGYTDR